jgi:hypothetical protein
MEAGRRKNHKDLILWQKAMALAAEVRRLTAVLPRHEMFGLTAQLRREAQRSSRPPTP